MKRVVDIGRCYGVGSEVMGGMVRWASQGNVGRVGGLRVSEYWGYAGVFFFVASGVIALGGPFYKDCKLSGKEGADKVSLLFKLNRVINKLCWISFGLCILCIMIANYLHRYGY